MKKIILTAIALSLVIASCKKEETITPTPLPIVYPSTYSFINVNHSGQTTRLTMLDEITLELKKANTGTVGSVDATKIKNMFANSGNPFGDAALDTSGKQLKSKCYAGIGANNQVSFEYLMTRQGTLTASFGANTWSAGNAGIATSGTKKYFFDENGVEYTQLIEKGLMGAVFYYNIAENYTRPAKIGSGVDNTTVTAGEGTDMEHHWDEAFGYFGAPIDFSKTNTTGAKFHAKYAKKGEDAGLGTIKKVMDQFIKGRHGISNKNYDIRDAAAVQVREEYEIILVTTAIHYLNSTKSNFSDDALRNHTMSEAYAFIFSLAYNTDKKISNTDLATVLSYFEITVGPQTVPSFIGVTVADINLAIDKLSQVYGLDAVKTSL